MDKSKAAAAIFDKHARLYQEKYMDTDLYHDTFTKKNIFGRLRHDRPCDYCRLPAHRSTA